MTSRKRLRQLFTGKSLQNDGQPSVGGSLSTGQARDSREARRNSGRNRKRQHLLETLESRQMLAGPQLIGIQPNEGDLIVEGTVRNVAPRSLTFRFDEVQQIDPSTFSGIQITRSGSDKTFGTADDVQVVPGLVTLGDIRQNEVVVRFAENLPDDNYRITVAAFDDPARGITALRNINGEAIQPSIPGALSETINFKLNLGALVEAIVPQPVVRDSVTGRLTQRSDEILVYFNEDELFVENDPVTGDPTDRSAENPRFYQLLLTRETVSTIDDALFFPKQVIYDAPTNTARLIFQDDLNDLAGPASFGGTYRLRVGAAVDNKADLVFAPTRISIANAGDTLTTAADVGAFSGSTSLIVSGAITPQSFGIQLPGSTSDPGRLPIPDGVGGSLVQVINERFGPDSTAGITEVTYNFKSSFAGGPGTGIPTQLNNITNVQKQRIREALSLWSRYLGVQFRETADTGITFAVGNVDTLSNLPNTQSQTFPQLDARVRVDSTFDNAAIVFSSQASFGTAYGQDFFRKSMAGIGFMLGLEQASDLTPETVMSLDSVFLNESINPLAFLAPAASFLPFQTSRQQTINDAIDSTTIDNPAPNALAGSEPSFPGNYDILLGQHLYRPDGNDVDLYRFTVDLAQGNATGELSVETFAERLADSSLLDTTVTLFKEQGASALADFRVGSALSVRFDAVQSGPIGNNARIEFIQSSRAANDTAVKVTRITGLDGALVTNAIRVDVPRKTSTVTSVPVSALIDAINNDAFASTLFRASLAVGVATTDISRAEGGYAPVVLRGGGIVQLARNDDYFSEDSFLKAELANGVYYIGVAASGNDTYDPTQANSGFGGKTQGNYDLQIKFSPRISEVDSIRDKDTVRAGVPGTAIDGDGDGLPGGVKNFWFQTRPLERMIEITGNGASIVAGQILTVTGANGVSRRFEFVNTSINQQPAPGNIPIQFTPATTLNSALIADRLRSQINLVSADTGVRATASGSVLTLTGERSIQLSANFRGATVHGRTIFVDKSGSVVADGTLNQPFNTIANPAVPNAFGATFPNDIVRIVGNGGQDGKIETIADNFAYQIGTPETGGGVLPDGRNMEVPKGVTVMIDAGAAFKLRNSTIRVGSSNLQLDRSGGAIQILGTPRLVSLTDPSVSSTGVALVLNSIGQPVSGSVTFTSTRDRSVDSAASGNSPTAAPGNWGGLIFRRDVDESQGRRDLEDEGIFLQIINHADIRFGGGSNILVDANQVTVNPIQLIDLRPTITFNRLTSNASAAISASPDSFEETSFQAPQFQQASQFTPDYGRVGPDINNNVLTNNSINGLFIRTESVPGQALRQLTVAGRFDDVDIVHYIAENIVVAGTPGGSIEDGVTPDFSSVATTPRPGGGLTTGSYSYRMTFVDANGFESLASPATTPRAVVNGEAIELVNLPAITSGLGYVSRRLYRLSPGETNFQLAANLPSSGSTFVDNGRFTGATLDLTRTGIRGRLDASLVVDPGTVVKFRGARIELGQGTQLLAEGTPERPVIFTSALDDRFGGGGSFDTNNDRNTPGGGAMPRRGDWSGIYAGPNSNVSLDNAVVAYGGGVSLIEGGQSRGFLALELQQASGRIANSRFEFNDHGQDGSGPVGRNGRLAITPATIFVRGSQPTIVGNQFVDNFGSIIDIDLGSMTAELLQDLGRQTGALDRFTEFDDNHGPLIRLNTTSSPAGDVEGRRQLNGLRIRGGQLTTESVWDDTDIAHVLFDSVVVGNQISGGALTLKSRPDESLVIKMLGEGTPNSPTLGTGFTATGSTSDIPDRIGGTIHVLGLPGAPVVFTSYKDDSIGAGRRLDGTAQNDTNGDGIGSRPSPNDWRSLYFDGLSNDRNLAVIQEQELSTAVAPGLNGSFQNAQVLGDLAERLTASDDQLRLGFEVRGYLSEPSDIDTYSFSGVSGTLVWIDVDKTTFSLDTVIEVLDPQGVVVARSVNSFDEFGNPSKIFTTLSSAVGPLADQGVYADTWDSGLYADFGSTNPRDAGLRIALPGTAGIRNNYFVRVRSASDNPDDAQGGNTKGAYTFQIRLQEAQEFPGSVVQFADIRFANHGIHLQSLPGSSPLLGEAQENESADPGFNVAAISGGSAFGTVRYPTNVYANNDVINGGLSFPLPVTGIQTRPLNARAQYLGNLADSKTGTISVGGSLSTSTDIDFYQVDVGYGSTLSGLQRSTVFDIDFADGLDRPDTNLSIFYSATGNPNDARLVLFGQNSNILDDQSSPLSSIDIGEMLTRGSVRTGDAFIGPVSLPQGAYFVAVTENGRIPQELTSNPTLRREPIESVRRIFDDAIEAIGGRTAEAPVERTFIGSVSTGWEVTTDRASARGNQRNFNAISEGSTVATVAAGDQEQGNGQFQNAGGQPLVPDVDYVDGHLLIAFQAGVTKTRQQELLGQLGLTLLKEFPFSGSILVGMHASDELESTITDIAGIPEILYAEPDYINQSLAIPNDPLFVNMWGLQNTGQTGGTPGADIRATTAWDEFTGSPQTVIAILDSGVDYNHPDLIANMWVNPGEIPGNGIDDDGNGYIDDIYGIDTGEGDSDPMDNNGHGTHVAGTVGAVGNNGIGVTGVSWNSKIMAMKVGNATFGIPNSAAIEALDYLVNMKTNFGVNIVASNNSYGGGSFSFAFQNAIQASNNVGIVFVAAAGNSSFSNDIFPQYPASYPLDGIIAVASTDHNDRLSGFSNFGATSVDIAAPGSAILSTTLGGGYGLLSGTSMASPHVAGAVGLLAGFQPSATVADLKNAILSGADQLPTLAGTSVTGARLNLAQALENVSFVPFNESIRFNRSIAQGVLTSSSFDLAGYSAADLPRFYFDYFLDAAPNDAITVRATSDQQLTPINLPVNLNRNPLFGTWRQSVSSLGALAGHTGIVIEFVYDVDQTASGFEGLYLDNFVVGFAERGEAITGALPGSANFSNPLTSPGGSVAVAGAYQLEMRPSTVYGRELQSGVLIQRFLSDDDSLLQPVWIEVPSVLEIVPYSTIDILVENVATGLDEVVSFQFVPSDEIDQFVGSDTLYAVQYSLTDTDNQVATEFIRTVRSVTTHRFLSAGQSNFQLTNTFDTNDRHAQQLTLIAPAGSTITDGDRFVIGDGKSMLTLEFNTTNAVAAGNIRVPYSATDTAPMVARRIIDVINSGTVQTILSLKASTASGVWDFSSPGNLPTDAQVALHGTARGDFMPVTIASAPGAVIERNTDGTLRLEAIFHSGRGDVNTVRTQGQVIVDSNRISDVRAIGIWSDVGFRGTDPEDDRSPEVFGAFVGKSHLRKPPVGNSQLGAAINLPTLNNSVIGGLTPGVTVTNNIIDQAGFSGVKVDGETRPFIIEWNGNPANYVAGGAQLQSRGDILVPDGFMFAIDAGGTRVVFEFEDVSGAPTPVGGSGVVGGDGFVDGHVPIYYRLGEGGSTYNPSLPAPIRNFGYSAHELMMAIHEAIQGSILVTNGLVELVRPTIGPSITSPVGPQFRSIGTDIIPPPFFSFSSVLDFANPAVYLEGVTGIYSSFAFQKAPFAALLNITGAFFNPTTGVTGAPPMPLAPVYEAPQPLAKIINNTIYGADGTEASYLSDGSLSRAIQFPTTDSGETIGAALDTKQGRAHRGAYIAQGILGDNSPELSADKDVDFYKVELSVGDRLIVDIDTLAEGPAAAIRLFDSRGIEQAVGEDGEIAEHLKPDSSIEFPRAAVTDRPDRFIDFTAESTGTYYIGISSQGNESYDALSLSGRTTGTGGVGAYELGIEVLAPRTFIFSLDSHPLTPFGAEVTSGNINGTDVTGGPNGARSLIGTTFTISQIPDYLIPTRSGDAYANVNADGNRVTFEFTAAQQRIVLDNGNINVPLIQTAFGPQFVPDIMRAIANAINGYVNNPALPNHENGNGPDGANGPVSRVKARALGGSQVDNLGIENLMRLEGSAFAPFPGGGLEFTSGFGHDRRESGGTANVVPDGTFTDSQGTTEIYALIENAAKIELSPEARTAGLKLGPDNSRLANVTLPNGTLANGPPRNAQFATESDQLLTEFGILISGGASAAILNNVVSNAHQSIVKDESSVFGFGGRIDVNNPDRNVKPSQVVLTGNAIQFDDERNTQIRSDLSWWIGAGINVVNRNPVLDTSLSTDLRTGPSNVAGGNSDFNLVVRPEGTPGQSPGNFIVFAGDNLLENPSGNRFTPVVNAAIVDSAVDSIFENTALAALKNSVGIPSGLIIAPTRDNSGQLRADDPFSAPPGGLGSNVFKDRGALDRADFVGPVAVIETPRDNDALGIDTDPAVSFLQLSSGIYSEFRILLQDNGDASDPFVGSGIDNNTVVVPVIEGLRANGAVVALFEGDRLLTEGVDYTFSYDTTKNVITLRPLAGIWKNDRAYRIRINNRDRIVGVAPAAGQVLDGDSFVVVDDRGGRVTFEYDSGYQLRVPETLQFTVPSAGAGTGGISDGDLFSITGVDGIPVVFEFNRDATKLPNTREVRFNVTDTPAMIASSARAAIAAAKTAGLLDVDVDVSATGPTVVIGSNAGTVLAASRSGLVTAARTLALRVPTAGAGPAGVADGDVLTINDGNTTVSFEFEIQGGLNNGANTPIPIAGLAQADGVLAAILTAIENSALRLNPIAIGNDLFLGLPVDGFASVSRGNLTPVGISRTPVDGETITFTPTTITPVTFELTQDGLITPGNIPIDYTRLTTGDQLAALIANAIQSQTITGLDPRTVQANPGGLVSIGGTGGLGLELNPTSSMLVTGRPDVTGPTTLTIFGPLLLQIPILGGNGIPDDSQFTLTDGTNTVTFIYNIISTGVANINATPITYQAFEDSNTLAAATVAAINASGLDITATNLGNGQISLGSITDNQISFPPAPAVAAPLSPQRGIVTDGDQITITQAGQTIVFEFELAVGGGGVTQGAIPVVFQSTNSIDEVANILAASINNNRGNLNLVASALPGGQVRIVDTPQTVTVVSNPTTLSLSGTAGGAVPIAFTGSFTAQDIKRSTIDAINKANAEGKTTLTSEDRGGASYFIENAVFIDGDLPNYYLEGVKDLAGQLLKPTRIDNTTQFTLLLPSIGLDYGDAPDVNGRYPTLLESDGPRHIVSDQVRLGRLIDIDSNGLPNEAANGDDTTIFIVGTPSPFFTASIKAGFVEVIFNVPPGPISTVDGSTITLSTGVDTATLEFDTDGIFNESNFSISVNGSQAVTLEMIAQAFVKAINESPLRPADVLVVDNIVNGVPVPGTVVHVVTDDEDGVNFTSEFNPGGVLNRGISTPISVTVTGGGILEAWIDFNFDGDFNDPGEQIINRFTPGAVFSANALGTPVKREFIIMVPATAPNPTVPTATYARFRISAEGGLSPTGLALSGEVEDYRLMILPGLPPTVIAPDPSDPSVAPNNSLTYTVDEDSILQARDADGTLTPGSANDDGALAAIRDSDGDQVAVFAGDVGTKLLKSSSGIDAGSVTLFADGTFTFVPVADFFGSTQFSFRVTDVKPNAPETQLVSPVAMTVNIIVDPVNDPPFVTGPAPVITRTIDEDTVQLFLNRDLTTAFYSPGPANESAQMLVIQSAGVNGVGFQTLLGGTLTLIDGNLQYTPPANFPGPGPDRFNYVVADVPTEPNQLVQSAETLGTVIINIVSVNDPPIAGTDTFTGEEDTPLTIPVTGPNGILANDVAGPPDEVAAGQTVSLIAADFPRMTARGGTVTLNAAGTLMTYTPPADFSGQDQFTYRIVDTGIPPQTASGTVLINVIGDNDPPVFIGVNGVPGVNSLTFNESKEQVQVFTYNLSSWFFDPEGDASTFEVQSTNPDIVSSVVTRDAATGVSTLTLTLPSFRPGNAKLNITATNIGGPSSTAQVDVLVINTPDPPTVIAPLDPVNGFEDEDIVIDLAGVFSDPDNNQLTYKVTRLGTQLNPTAAQIAASPLVKSITFSGDTMTIVLEDDAFGSVDLEIAASDGIFEVRDAFTLNVASVPDAPRAVPDFYNVPIGSRFEIIDPSQGLLANDSDPDNDVFPGTNEKIRVDLSIEMQPTFGTVTVNENGTFVYTNLRGRNDDGTIVQTDTFSYRPIDPTGRTGDLVTVTFNLGRSRYQNPIPGFAADVTANGVISPLDALRVINRIAAFRRVNPPNVVFTVSTITTAPPDFIDVNGDGLVTPQDALLVINEISRQNRTRMAAGEGEGANLFLSTTVAYAAPTTFGLTETNRVAPLPSEPEMLTENTYDPFAAGFDVVDRRVEQSTEDLLQLDETSESSEKTTLALDEILSSWSDPINL